MPFVESELDSIYRRSAPEHRWRYVVWVLVAFAVNYLHVRVRPAILAWLSPEWVAYLYLKLTGLVILTATFLGLGAFVVTYYFALRNRRTYTALTETGLAVRGVLAGLLALFAAALAVWINDGV
jgi:hypothetical protein